MQGRRAAQTTFCLWQTFLELRSIYSKVRGRLKCSIVSPLSISKSVTSEWLLVSTLHRVGSREVCAFGLAGQEGREDFLPPPHRTRGKRFLPALRSQTLVAAPPGGNSEQLPGTQRGGLELTEGRSWAITWGSGGGDIRREQAPVGPTSRLLPRRIYSSPYPIFSFSRHTRYFPIGRNQNLKQKQNQLRESRKTGGRPGFGAAGCGGSQTQ